MRNDPLMPTTSTEEDYRGYFAHESALVETNDIGAGTRIWAFCHVLAGASIGSDCNIGDHCYIEQGVRIGDMVVVKNGVSIWEGVTLEDHVFVGPNVAFTNDIRPRANTPVDEWLRTTVGLGASLGANSTILPGIRIGNYATVGAGSVVTRDVLPYALVIGNPAHIRGYVCDCARPLKLRAHSSKCSCGLEYEIRQGVLSRCQ